MGWWLSTRVLDADGFADVVAISSQRKEVRDYIADQATLRLARTSNFVSAARPIVADAVSQAIATPPVEEAVHDFAARAHEQIFRFTEEKRVSVSSAQAAITVRTALESINPSLAKKVPPERLSATTTISQSPSVDTLVGASRWVQDLYIPVFLIGVALLALVIWKSKDRVHAIRVSGILLAVAGALLFGIGAATPAFADAAATNDPGRGEAVAQFIDVLVGRLVGAGKGMVVVGIALGARARSRRWRPAAPLAAGQGVVRRHRASRALAFRRWARARAPRAVRPDDPRRRRLGAVRGRGGARALRGNRRVPARDGRARHRSHDQADPQARGRAGARRAGRGDRGDRRPPRSQSSPRAPRRRRPTPPTRVATATSSCARSR